jgi:hypothetical protein
MPTQADVRKRLWMSAELTALRHGLRYHPPCKAHVLAFIDKGVVNLTKKDALNDSIRLQLSEDGVTALVEEMVVIAKAKKLKRLEEQTFFPARDLLCPLWPFC